MLYDIKRILYASDLSERGTEVFRHALGIAARFGAEISLLHVIPPIGDFAQALIEAHVPEETKQRLRERGYAEARAELQRRLERVRDAALDEFAQAPPKVEIVVRDGAPAEVVLEEARRREADLIVLGSHGHSALGEALLGSVAHKVTMRAPVPVLLVPLRG